MEKPTFKEESLKYHIEGKPGKLEVRATTPLETQADLSMAYSPGVAHACEYIVEDPLNASQVTARGNLVAVISNGTAVLGLGHRSACVETGDGRQSRSDEDVLGHRYVRFRNR